MTDDQNPQNLTSPDPPAPDDRAPDDMRTEQAFRDAFATHAGDVNSEGITIPTRTGPRLHWLAVAAAVIVVAMIGALAIRQFSLNEVADGPTSLVSTPPPATATGPQLGSLPAPEPGFQWVSSRDVAVQVPGTWGFANAPQFTNLCSLEGKPQEEPYYSTFTGVVPMVAIACPGTLTRERDVMHLRLVRGNTSDPFPEWYRVKEVSGIQVAVAVPSGSAEDEALAEKILASATTFTADQAGCTPRSPIDRLPWVRPAPASDIEVLSDVSSISVCQYERPVTAAEDQRPGPRLVASAVIPAAQVQGLLQAIRSAPATDPAEVARCAATQPHDDGVVLRLQTSSGAREMYVYVDDCHGGIDDGTTVRTPVADWCGPATRTKPVGVVQMSSRVDVACSTPSASPTPTSPAPSITPSQQPSPTSPPAALSGLPAPMDGFQWVSSRDVAVQVPAEWNYATAPGGDWCGGAKNRFPSVPYYSSFTGSLARMAIGCPGLLPREQDVMHLALSSPYGDPVDHQAWHRTRDMGNVLVTVAVPSGLAADEALADKILATARTFIRDHVGCAPRSPIDLWAWTRPSEKFDVTDVGQIDSLSLCQYQKSPESAADTVPGPRLIASQRLTGDAARAMLSAIQQSPVGGGPNLPDSCLAEYHDTSAIVVRLATAQGVRELYATVGNCRNNGIDDGTNLRAVTPGWCSPLFTKPLLWSSMSGAVASLCDPAGQVPGATPSPTR